MKKIICGALLAVGIYGGCEGMMETDQNKDIAMENDCEKYLSVFSSYPFLAGREEDEEIAKINWQEVADNTEPLENLSWCSPMAMRSLRGDPCVDWHIMLEDAVNGDPVAQYCMAEKYDLASRLTYGQHKNTLQIAMSLFIFISAQKGKYKPAQSVVYRYIPDIKELDFSSKNDQISKAVKLFIESGD